MPFNGSGSASGAVGGSYPATASTLIESAKFNTLVADFLTMFSTALLKDGQQTVTADIPFAGFAVTNARIRAIDGVVGTPGISFKDDTDCGFYRIGVNNIGLALAGAKVVDFTTAGIGLADAPILDSSGNEFIKFSKAASAVNELTLANAATSGIPRIEATGGDSVVNLELKTKGAGSGSVFTRTGADVFRVIPDTAAGGVFLDSLNAALSDYEPLILTGEYLSLKVRIGAGSSAERARLDASGGLYWGTGVATYGLIVKRKTADESVTSSITLQDDDHLTHSIAANEEWVEEFYLDAGAALATPGIKLAINAPAGATLNAVMSLITDAGAAANVNAMTQRTTSIGIQVDFPASVFTGSANGFLHLSVWVLNGANAGSVTLQWAQSTSSGTATTLRKGSHMTAHRVA